MTAGVQLKKKILAVSLKERRFDVRIIATFTFFTRENKIATIILLHVNPLLGNGLVNKFPRRQILGKQSVARLSNNKESCVFCVRGDVTTVDSDYMTCFL
jgi:hypothetical protein